jgi:glycosyltransferase involved in cell wall biosynthesis
MTVEPAHGLATAAAQASALLRVALVYDMDSCKGPTGVTRHALAQIDGLRARTGIELRLLSGRVTEPDGRAYWESLEGLTRRELPIRTRNALRWWRFRPWPPVELWSGSVDWVYSPAEYALPARGARRAVTVHDILQVIRYRPPSHRERLARTLAQADLILSVSRFNTERLLEHFPECAGRVEYVPNGAEDLFFEPPTERERLAATDDLGLPPGLPYLLSVANFEGRKNLDRLVRAAARLPEVASGALALVLLGTGTDAEERVVRNEVARLGRRVVVRLPGYRQGRSLRAAYAGAKALVFPSLCESFGIPAVEAMAQGVPVALADSTALPEIAGAAGWYFDPAHEETIAETLADLLARPDESARRVALGRGIALGYRWQAATDRLVDALTTYHERPRRNP